MSDEEILKHLAEIEGWETDSEGWAWPSFSSVWINSIEDICWADLGPLIEKYRLNICPPFDGESTWRVDVLESTGDAGIHESLPHAICLAILAAREKGNE